MDSNHTDAGVEMDSSAPTSSSLAYWLVSGNLSLNVTPTDMPDYHTVADWVFLTLSLALILPIVFGNMLVLVSIVHFPHLHTPTHVLIGSLAAADLVIGIVTIPTFSVVHHARIGLETEYASCLSSYILSHCPTGVSLLTLLLIAIERWVAIHMPFLYPRVFKWKWTIVAAVSVWAYIWLLGILLMFRNNRWRPGLGDCNFADVASHDYMLMLAVHMLGVFVITTVLHLSVAATACRAHRAIIRQTRSVGGDIGMLEKDARVARMLLLVLGVFYLCWVPYFLTLPFALRVKGHDPLWLHIWEQLGGVIVLSNSCFNPLIYARRDANFRSAFRKLLGLNGVQVASSWT